MEFFMSDLGMFRKSHHDPLVQRVMKELNRRWLVLPGLIVIALVALSNAWSFWSAGDRGESLAFSALVYIWSALMIALPLVVFLFTRHLRSGPLRIAIVQSRFNETLFIVTKLILYFFLYASAFISCFLAWANFRSPVREIVPISVGSSTAILIALFITWVFIIVLATRWIRRIYREIDLVCPSCLYEREGRGDTTVCPECGYTDPSFDNAEIDSV